MTDSPTVESKIERRRRLNRESQARCRARRPKPPRRRSRTWVPLPSSEVAEILVEAGALKEWDAENPEQIGEALRQYLLAVRSSFGID